MFGPDLIFILFSTITAEQKLKNCVKVDQTVHIMTNYLCRNVDLLQLIHFIMVIKKQAEKCKWFQVHKTYVQWKFMGKNSLFWGKRNEIVDFYTLCHIKTSKKFADLVSTWRQEKAEHLKSLMV